MKRPIGKSTVPLFVVVALGIVVWVYAGDLDPPAGPVTPTMHTLDDIYNLVATPGGSDCPPCVWDKAYVEARKEAGEHETQVVSGSGVVHAVMLPHVSSQESERPRGHGSSIMCQLGTTSFKARGTANREAAHLDSKYNNQYNYFIGFRKAECMVR